MLLKGATQLVATPGGETVDVAVPGPAWTGQAGSGDVLGGLCAALLAAGCRRAKPAVLGASVQAMAAGRRIPARCRRTSWSGAAPTLIGGAPVGG